MFSIRIEIKINLASTTITWET